MVKPKIGASLIIWRERAWEDLSNLLDEVSHIGYEGVDIGRRTLEYLEKIRKPKELFDEKKLSVVGLHIGNYINSLDRDFVDSALHSLQNIGGKFICFNGAGGKENSEDNFLKSAVFLEDIGKKAVRQGIKVCYHNHWPSIANDARGIRILCDNTSPEYVSLCIDTYWVEYVGVSAVELIKEKLDRLAFLHLKDGTKEGMKNTEFVEVGNGIIDFPAIFEVAKSADIEWYVVEHDRTNRTPKESMKISFKYIKEELGL